MRKFRNTFNRTEIVTFEEIQLNPDYVKCVTDNYTDDTLFADWLITQDYTPLDIWEMDTRKKGKVRHQFLLDCKEMAITDLDFEEILE